MLILIALLVMINIFWRFHFQVFITLILGYVYQYSLPNLHLDKYKDQQASNVYKISKCEINADSSMLLMVDISGGLKMIKTSTQTSKSNVIFFDRQNNLDKQIEFEKKDVWNFKWYQL